MSRESLQSTKRMDDLCANKEAGASPETSNIPKQEDKCFMTASQENQEQLDQASVSNRVDSGGFKPQLSCGLMVKRERLLKDLKLHGPQAGITVISAPEGMGKTALLLQYVGEVRQDPARGSACLVDASNMDSEDLYIKLKALSHELPPVMHPLIAVDNMPALGSEALKVFPELLRTLRDKGFEFVLSCRPKMHELSQVLGDSYKLGAQALAVRPREYSSWAQAFAIDRTLDVYGLTQGIPSLVVTLQSFDGRTFTSEPLEKTAVELYESILSDLRAESEGMYRLACLLLLMGEGEVVALHRDNWRIRAETTAQLAREYPMFGLDPERKNFSCLALHSKGFDELRKHIAHLRPAFAQHVVNVLIASHRSDEGVRLVEMMDDQAMALQTINTWPLRLALEGNGGFVERTLAKLEGESAVNSDTGVVLALHASALVSGEYRVARSMASELFRRKTQLEKEVPGVAIDTACALASIWDGCHHVDLPKIPGVLGHKREDEFAKKLRRHIHVQRELFDGSGAVSKNVADGSPKDLTGATRDIPSIFVQCDEVLNLALHDDMGDALAWDKHLQGHAQWLRDRGAKPVAEYARMTAATCRLMAGERIVDERAFVDAGTSAVRASDFALQLFCLVAEGWQSLVEGQVVNARFRAQQVIRLAKDEQVFLRSWAYLLERSAFIVNSAKFTLAEEADLIDLARTNVDTTEAWTVALLLSAAGYTSELSAWFSLNRNSMLKTSFKPLALQAMRAVGDRADALRYILPPAFAVASTRSTDDIAQLGVQTSGDFDALDWRCGQIEVRLFGGFRIKRNGHALTDSLWRRKRLCALTARLVLGNGSFIDRHAITDEMWPASEYIHARENLYSALSALRTAFGQQESGPQYILTQGDGVAINCDYVLSDVTKFDALARNILLKRTGTSGREIIESCLKLEELYAGPLYVADMGNPTFHLRMKKLYEAKFVDCMLRGVDAALELDDLSSASWLVEAAQRQAPYREDAMRQAMRIYDRCGRRREIVEMYSSHLHYLKEVAHAIPEDETRLAYESIMGSRSLVGMM